MIQWQKRRDPETCESYHVMCDGEWEVATVRNIGKGPRKFQVQIKQNAVWHRRTLQSAKSDAEWIYVNTKNDTL